MNNSGPKPMAVSTWPEYQLEALHEQTKTLAGMEWLFTQRENLRRIKGHVEREGKSHPQYGFALGEIDQVLQRFELILGGGHAA